MKKILFCLMALITLVGCSKEDEQIEQNTFDKILGRWNVTAYYSGSYYTPINNGDYYEFMADKTCVYYSGNVLNTYDYYQYSFLSTNQIACKHENGWDLVIQVEFTGDNEAIFHVIGKTSNSTKTVKVKRN